MKKFEHIMDKSNDQFDFTLEDVLNEAEMKQLNDQDFDGQTQEEVNKLLEDVWEDLS